MNIFKDVCFLYVLYIMEMIYCPEDDIVIFVADSSKQGWGQEFSDGGLTLPTRGLKYGFQGTINTKNLRQNRFSPSDGGLACSDGWL